MSKTLKREIALPTGGGPPDSGAQTIFAPTAKADTAAIAYVALVKEAEAAPQQPNRYSAHAVTIESELAVGTLSAFGGCL